MIEIIIYILIGMFIGWNFPQPAYAAKIQTIVVGWIKSFWSNVSS